MPSFFLALSDWLSCSSGLKSVLKESHAFTGFEKRPEHTLFCFAGNAMTAPQLHVMRTDDMGVEAESARLVLTGVSSLIRNTPVNRRERKIML